jgi:hypothetical protein
LAIIHCLSLPLVYYCPLFVITYILSMLTQCLLNSIVWHNPLLLLNSGMTTTLCGSHCVYQLFANHHQTFMYCLSKLPIVCYNPLFVIINCLLLSIVCNYSRSIITHCLLTLHCLICPIVHCNVLAVISIVWQNPLLSNPLSLYYIKHCGCPIVSQLLGNHHNPLYENHYVCQL